LALGFIAYLLMAVSLQTSAVPDRYLARIEWSQIDQSPAGITANECVLVFPDGQFHMERRLQQLPTPSATLLVYESKLSDEQLQQLRIILDSDDMRGLPTFLPFAIPGPVPVRQAFEARIPRNSDVQRVGYATWKATSQSDSDAPARDALKDSQRKSETALQPLFKWFNDVDSQKLVPSNTESTFCEVK